MPIVKYNEIEPAERDETVQSFEDDLRDSATYLAGSDLLAVRVGRSDDIAIGATVEVLKRGGVVASGELLVATVKQSPGTVRFFPDPYESTTRYVRLVGELDELHALTPESPEVGEWTVAIRGDAALALRDVNATAYWNGQVTIPLGVRE